MKTRTVICLFVLTVTICTGCKDNGATSNANGFVFKAYGNLKGPVEILEVHSDGKYSHRTHSAKEDSWQESHGVVPNSILELLARKGLKSREVRQEDDDYVYIYDFAISYRQHPSGIAELFDFIYSNEKPSQD